MIDDAVVEMYSEEDRNRFLEVTYQNGDKEVLYFRDFASGAMVENIVRRAKKSAIKRQLAGGPRGICPEDMVQSVRQEFSEHEDLPNTTNPDDWAKISGKKGERIVYVRTLVTNHDDQSGGRSIEGVGTGQYLCRLQRRRIPVPSAGRKLQVGSGHGRPQDPWHRDRVRDSPPRGRRPEPDQRILAVDQRLPAPSCGSGWGTGRPAGGVGLRRRVAGS